MQLTSISCKLNIVFSCSEIPNNWIQSIISYYTYKNYSSGLKPFDFNFLRFIKKPRLNCSVNCFFLFATSNITCHCQSFKIRLHLSHSTIFFTNSIVISSSSFWFWATMFCCWITCSFSWAGYNTTVNCAHFTPKRDTRPCPSFQFFIHWPPLYIQATYSPTPSPYSPLLTLTNL